MKTYGETVRVARKGLDLTLEAVAKRIGTPNSKGYISWIESGRVKPPSAKVTRKLAKALKLDVNQLLVMSWVEKAPPEIQAAVEGAMNRHPGKLKR